MKKIIYLLAGALAAMMFSQIVSAVPSFARQTGMACSACHSQHFPILNSFGRSFKAGGYTLMGTQGKVEGEHLSIPNVLNASLVLKLRYQKDNTDGAAAGTTDAASTLGDGQVQWDEFALFFGGRIAENIGFVLEGKMLGGSLLAGVRIPFVFDMGPANLSVVPFTTDAMGVQMGYEQSSGGVYRANRWAEHRRETSAVQYNADRSADGGAASGLALVVASDIGHIALTKWAPNFQTGPNSPNGGGYTTTCSGVDPNIVCTTEESGAGKSSAFNSNYVRIAATPTFGDWAMVVGGGVMSGSSYSPDADGKVDTQQTFYDLQAQGEVGGKPLAVYIQHAKAEATATGNIYNPTGVVGAPDRKATTIGVDYSVLPNVLSIGAAYRSAENGKASNVNGDNAATVTGVYDLYQNVALHINHSIYSGSSRDTASAQKNLTTLMLEGAW
jgi:hypothetical protein